MTLFRFVDEILVIPLRVVVVFLCSFPSDVDPSRIRTRLSINSDSPPAGRFPSLPRIKRREEISSVILWVAPPSAKFSWG